MRQLPHNQQAEEALLGIVLMSPDALSTALNAGLKPTDFYQPANRIIYSELESMLASGKAIELAGLTTELSTKKLLNNGVSMEHLIAVSGIQPTSLNLASYIEAIRNTSVIREVIREASTLVESCYEFKGELPETLDKPISKLLNIAQGNSTDQELSWDKCVEASQSILENMVSQKGLPEDMILHWPWPAMDEYFNPMQRGQLIVLGARPSVGKSSLARQVAVNVCKQKRKVYFVTLEVDPKRVPLQIAATMARVGLRQVAKAHHAEQDSLREALSKLRGLGFTISSRDRTMARIIGRARALHAKGELDLLVIDHGLLVDDVAQSKKDEVQTNISRLTKALKAMATELNVCVLLLWQLNRASVQDQNREPNLTDLKQSGSLEEDADKVIFIHRPSQTPEGIQQKETDRVEDAPRWFQNVIQAKGRDDGTSFISMSFERQIASFTPIKNP